MKNISVLGFVGALAASACAETQAPTDQLVATKVAIATADNARAKDIPLAVLHRKLANDQLQDAQNMIADGDNAKAVSMLARAKADAELAVALSHQTEVAHEGAPGDMSQAPNRAPQPSEPKP